MRRLPRIPPNNCIFQDPFFGVQTGDVGPTKGYISAVDAHGRTIWIPDAHRDDWKRFVVRADEKLTAYRYFFC